MTFSTFDMTQPHNVIHVGNDVEVLHAANWSSDITISLVYCKKSLEKKSHVVLTSINCLSKSTFSEMKAQFDGRLF